MNDADHLIRDVSDTALWVAAYRADETERRRPLFRDPFARRLAGERGAEIARRVRRSPIRGAIALRTAVIDELVTAAACSGAVDAVLDLAAGLDTRPYRLALPASLRWVEVDLPPLLEYKRGLMSGTRPACDLESVGADLGDADARRRLFGRLERQGRRTLVLTEGLLGYLDRDEVGGLAGAMAECGCFVEWMTDLLGADVAARLGGAGDELKRDGQARIRFAPEEGTAFFEPHGWREHAFHDLFEESRRLGREGILGRLYRAYLACVPPEKRARMQRGIGVVRLVPTDRDRTRRP